jgi:hypothetical protein
MNFDDSIHLDSELTWEDAAQAVYYGVKESKLSVEDLTEFFRLASSEAQAPRNTRILAKTLSTFFDKCYTELRDGEHPGVLVEIDNQKWTVERKGSNITVNGPVKMKDAPDRSFFISHDSEADAKISAWERGEKFVQSDE